MVLPSLALIDGFRSWKFRSRDFRLAFRPPFTRLLFAQGIFKSPRKAKVSARNTTSLAHTPVIVGTFYENVCLRALHRFGFSLTRTGGKSDKGIDLLGIWEPPVPTCASSSLRVIVQCKAYAGQVQPALIRELEGAVVGAPGEWRNDDTIGVLCTPKGATGGIRDAMRMAGRGIIWVTIEKPIDSEHLEAQAKVTQLLWNECVTRMVADGLGAGLKFMPGQRGVEQEVVLMLNGRVWKPKQMASA